MGQSVNKPCDRNFASPAQETSLQQFWSSWYAQTGDYSVGPAATIALDPIVNKRNAEKTRRILTKYRLVPRST
jgi:hypothetical protein